MELLTIPDIARARGTSRQAVQELWARKSKRLPKPDAMVSGRPAWKRSTLEKSGTLEPEPRR